MKTILVDRIQLNSVIKDVLLSNDFYERKKTTVFLDSNLYLDANPASLYSKHDKLWLKIRYQVYVNADDGKFIPYSYHGYLYEEIEFVSRECHSIHHQMISNAITKFLNQNRIGEIVKEIAN